MFFNAEISCYSGGMAEYSLDQLIRLVRENFEGRKNGTQPDDWFWAEGELFLRGYYIDVDDLTLNPVPPEVMVEIDRQAEQDRTETGHEADRR